jgi:hypothetical protein
MSEWRELTWDDAMQRGYDALVGGEARYEEIDAEQGRSNIDTESTCGALSTAPALPTQTSIGYGLVPGHPSLVSDPGSWQPSPVGLARLVTLPRRSLTGNAADWSCSLVGRVVGA